MTLAFKKEAPLSTRTFAERASRLADTTRRLRNYIWRLGQPVYWPQLARMVRSRLGPASGEKTDGASAYALCQARAIGVDEAFSALGLQKPLDYELDVRHGETLERARRRVEAASVRFGGGADIDLLYAICKAQDARRVLETGVAYGWSSLAFLCALQEMGDGRLVSIDLPYLGQANDHKVGIAVPTEFRPNWELLRGADRDMLAKGISGLAPLDLVHYDSDKTANGRRWAYPLLWDALRPGGIFMSDDISDNMAFMKFCDELGVPCSIVRVSHEDKYAGLARKP